MLQSLNYAQIILRLGLSIVFIWFGIDKFIHPDYWINAWFPVSLSPLLQKLGVSQMTFITAGAVMELILGVSILSGIFIRIFSALAVLTLLLNFFIFPFSEILVRNIALMAGLGALFFWPERRPSVLFWPERRSRI